MCGILSLRAWDPTYGMAIAVRYVDIRLHSFHMFHGSRSLVTSHDMMNML